MATPIHLWLRIDEQTKIDGSVDVKDREGSIEVLAHDHKISIATDDNTGKLKGTRVHGPIVFTKEIDASSPLIYKAVTTGQTIKFAEFKWYRTNDDGVETEYYRVELEGVKIVKVAGKMYDVKDPSKEKHNHLEEIEFRYEKITWTYVEGTLKHSDSWKERETA
ncbi:Hcp family type VI secretion system effector [Pseudomonas sp. LB3P31]